MLRRGDAIFSLALAPVLENYGLYVNAISVPPYGDFSIRPGLGLTGEASWIRRSWARRGAQKGVGLSMSPSNVYVSFESGIGDLATIAEAEGHLLLAGQLVVSRHTVSGPRR